MLGVGEGAKKKLLFKPTSITINDGEWEGLKLCCICKYATLYQLNKIRGFLVSRRKWSLFQDLNKKLIPHLQFNKTWCNMYIYINNEKHGICPFIYVDLLCYACKYLQKEHMIFTLYLNECGINWKLEPTSSPLKMGNTSHGQVAWQCFYNHLQNMRR